MTDIFRTRDKGSQKEHKLKNNGHRDEEKTGNSQAEEEYVEKVFQEVRKRLDEFVANNRRSTARYSITWEL